MVTRSFNLADLWEVLADAGPEETCLVAGQVRHTRRSLDERANQLGHLLGDLGVGVGAGDRVAVYARNRAEYLETLFGSWKAGAVPINVNWRYTAPELRQVLVDAGARVVVAERSSLSLLDAVAPDLDAALQVVVLEDSAAAGRVSFQTFSYEEGLAGQPTTAHFGAPRSGDDHYMLYTGGTTGMPRGVVWRHEDFFFACALGGDPAGSHPVRTPLDMASHVDGQATRILVLAPLMHGGGQWPSLIALYAGGRVILSTERSFDPHAVLRLVEVERPLSLAIVGDAMGRPLAEAALERPDRYDTSSLRSIGNGGAMLTGSVKEQLARAFPGAVLTDSYGASETGASGREIIADTTSSRPAFAPDPNTSVLDQETLEPLNPGSGRTGLFARRGHIPLGYWNDAQRTAATFRTDRHGVRWVLPGDHATVDEQGRIVLIGRGSGCINTGGEKVFPEEVEAALRSHPAVLDAVVVGVTDQRYGEAVTAMVELRANVPIPDEDELRAHCRTFVAGYKVPRHVVVGDQLRTNTGKPDYVSVRRRAAAVLGAGR